MINHQWDDVLIVLLCWLDLVVRIYIYIYIFLNTWKQNHLQFHACCVWYTAIICHYAAIKRTFHIQTIMYFLSLSFFQEPQTTVIHNPVDRNKVIGHISVSSSGLMPWMQLSSLKVIHKDPFTFLQESTESANTTIEDEDLKGKAWRLSACVSARRPAVCCCYPSSICLPSVLLLSHMYILSCLLSSPNLYSSSACCYHSLPPFILRSFPRLRVSVSVFLVECAIWNVFFFVCPAPVVSSSHWFNVQPDALETSALIQSGNPRAARKTPSPSRRPTPRCRVSP